MGIPAACDSQGFGTSPRQPPYYNHFEYERNIPMNSLTACLSQAMQVLSKTAAVPVGTKDEAEIGAGTPGQVRQWPPNCAHSLPCTHAGKWL